MASLQYWAWYDREFPGVWAVTHKLISLNANEYVHQADESRYSPQTDWRHRPFFRPPLASYYFCGLLALTNFDRLAVSLIQSLLACFAYLLLFLASLPFLPPIYALLGLAVIGFHPVVIFSDISFEDTTLSVFFLSLAIYFSSRYVEKRNLGYLVFSGTAAALVVLSRSNLVFFSGLLALSLALKPIGGERAKSGLATLGLFLAPLALALAFTAWHNGRTGGIYTPFVTTGGMSLYWGNSDQAYYLTSIEESTSLALLSPDNPTTTLLNEIRFRYPAPTLDASMKLAALDYIENNKEETFRRLVQRLLSHLSLYEFPRDDDFNDVRAHLRALQLPYLPYSLLFAFAVIGLAVSRMKYTLLIFSFPVVAVILTEAVFLNASRYRAMAIPFVVFLAFFGLLSVFRTIREKNKLRLSLAALFISACIMISYLTVTEQDKASYEATSLYKNLRLSLFNDNPCRFVDRFPVENEREFSERLDRILFVDPAHLPAFYLKTLFEIYNLKKPSSVVDIGIARRQTECQTADWLCHRTMEKLSVINENPAAYTQRVRELRSQGKITGCKGTQPTKAPEADPS